jgi:hypothetical protein
MNEIQPHRHIDHIKKNRKMKRNLKITAFAGLISNFYCM